MTIKRVIGNTGRNKIIISLTSPLYRENDTHFLTTFRRFLDFIAILSVAFVFSRWLLHTIKEIQLKDENTLKSENFLRNRERFRAFIFYRSRFCIFILYQIYGNIMVIFWILFLVFFLSSLENSLNSFSFFNILALVILIVIAEML